MVRYDCSHVWCATVTKFDNIFVANFIEPVIGGEMLFQKIEEYFADVCRNIFIIWRIEPNYIALPGAFSFAVINIAAVLKREIATMTALLQCFLV